MDAGLEIGFLGAKTGFGLAPVPPMGAVASDFSSVVGGLSTVDGELDFSSVICGLSTVDSGLEIGFLGAKTGLGLAPVPPMGAVAF
ncbi:MAG TPA: hypothetical protein DCM71_05455 [Runella sp.]|nr:hypothetical protein [Runella sp.]